MGLKYLSKKKKDIKVSFVGENSHDVTGSCILVEYKDQKILLECGLFQSNNVKKDYEINNRKLKFKVRELDYIFINHQHIDHCGLLPRLYKDGCTAKVIATHKTARFFEIMLKDSAYIIGKDSATLSRRSGKEVKPIYTESDVHNMLQYVETYNFDEIIKLDETISFRFIPAQHIIGSAQLELFIKKDSGYVEKLLYTSDLGNIQLDKPYVEKFQRISNASIVIAENTYGDNEKTIKKKDRQKDIEKLRSVISETCIDKKGRVLIPCFSLDRTQLLLTLLYDIFGEDENFKIPIILDSPLACSVTDIYKDVLDGEDRDLIEKVLSWENIKMITSVDESKACVLDKSPKVIISASGMLTAGRARIYIKNILPDIKSTVMFIGYSSGNSLASKIKNGKQQKTINIDGKPYKNRCSIVDLHSFTSHIQRNDMIKYYSSIQANSIYLVHGDFDGKVGFANDLRKELAKLGKSTRVVVTNKDMSISF